MVGIYKITSPSGKVYIGQSWNIEKRWEDYKNYKCKRQKKLYSSFLKYKVSSHLFEIVHELPSDIEQSIMDKYEIFYWEQYKSLSINMMNIKVPGIGGKGSKHRPETIELMKLKQKENHKNPNRKNNYHKVKVIQETLDGEFVKEWNSIKEAADYYNVSPAAVGHCVRGIHSSSLGFVWRKK